jgi:hypothetical protein
MSSGGGGDGGGAAAAAAAPAITFLERGELVELLLAGGRGTVVIDVRDDVRGSRPPRAPRP